MEAPKLRIALAQINTTVGDLKGNSDAIIRNIHLAESRECDVITFPELSITGYPPEDLLLKPKFVEDNLICLKEIAGKTGDIIAIVGFVDRDKNGLYNSAAIIYKNKVWGIYHKMFLPNYGVFDEKRYFSPGSKYLVTKLNGIYFGVNICEDIWEKDPVRKMSSLGIKLIFNINASPYHMGKINLRKKMLLGHSRKNKTIISYNNLVGGQDELIFDGRSLLISPNKGIIAKAKAFQEDLIITDIDVSHLKNGIKKNNSAVKVVNLPRKIKSKKLALEIKPVSRDLTVLDEVYSALILGLKDYVRKNNFKKAIVGLSGGIDSALTVALSVEALGKENVEAIFMPSKFTSPGSLALSRQLADNLGIKLKEISIGDIFEAFKKTLQPEFKGREEDITEENIQARIRGTILMAMSNKFGWLVVTTGNKSEMSTGYATLYGDMAGGFAMLKDVPKTLVFELAKYFNSKSDEEIIPKGIIEREPTAELRPNQKDSDTLPPYEVLDKIIKLYVEENLSIKEIINKDFDKEIVEKVINLIDKAEYKRRQSPPGIKITPRAFGRDRRMPITNRYKG